MGDREAENGHSFLRVARVCVSMGRSVHGIIGKLGGEWAWLSRSGAKLHGQGTFEWSSSLGRTALHMPDSIH